MKILTWQNPGQPFVAQELINKVKSKCCGIKVYVDRGATVDRTVSEHYEIDEEQIKVGEPLPKWGHGAPLL